MTPEEAAIAWHDVENGSYDVDLDVWHALAAAHAGRLCRIDVLEVDVEHAVRRGAGDRHGIGTAQVGVAGIEAEADR